MTQTSPVEYFSKDNHPVLQSYKQTSNKLQQQHYKVQQNQHKIHSLSKKISCLELLNRSSDKESMNYQRKLDKLETTQTYATQLLKLKYNSFMALQQDSSQRYNRCVSQRATNQRNKQLSLHLFNKNKEQQIRRIREEQYRVSQERSRKQIRSSQQLKEQAQNMKIQVNTGKQRLRRYQAFKLQRAALNYNQKLQTEYEKLLRKQRLLQQLKTQASKAQKTFRKTQRLNQQTTKIQSMYLTDSYADS